jgi:YD repeat-containing protein
MRGSARRRARWLRWTTGAIDAEPAPDQGSTCTTVGGGTICRFSHVEAMGPLDTGIVCGSGIDAFDIFDQFVDNESRTFWYDESGNLTRRTDHDVLSFGQWSNPTAGATVPYTQHNVETNVYAVPGDETSRAITFTGENIYRPGTGAPVLLEVGQQVLSFDYSEQL